MNDTTDQRRPEEIERDIRATQADMSRTVRQIEGELTPRNILDALLDKADDNGVDGRTLIDMARRNPLALGMIAAGGLWLVSDADARPSAMKLRAGRSNGSSGHGRTGADGDWHPEHRSYVEHMARCEPQPGEDDQTYRRRRDHARASYFMLEQGHEEDEGSFRRRLDEATEKLRERRERMSERTSDFVGHSRERAGDFLDQSRDRGRQAFDDARGFYEENPVMSGLAAAFVGAVIGSALPASRTEEAYVGGLGERAIDAAGTRARQAGEEARHRKDDMMDRVDEKLGVGETDGEGGSDRPPRFGERA